jgi:hypothetical protein
MTERFSLKIANYISDQLSEMTIEELEQVRIDCSRLTDTNCDWREYTLAPYIKGRAMAHINLKRG